MIWTSVKKELMKEQSKTFSKINLMLDVEKWPNVLLKSCSVNTTKL